jgi:hypothetical protein
MGELMIVGIFLAMLWIGWELTRIADFAEGFDRNYRDNEQASRQQQTQ